MLVDASIWIDLSRTDIFSRVKLLPYQMEMTDFVWNEVADQDQMELEGFGLVPTSFSAEEVDEIYILHNARRTLSPADCSNLILALKFAQNSRVIFLAVHDSTLHKEAVRQGISCKDGLDLLDEMVDEKIIDVSEACGYLTSLGRGRPEVVMRRTGALLEKWYEKS